MRNLTGRRALVTGASGGLGRSIAEGLAAAGADLALSGRNEAALSAAAMAVRGLGRTAAVVPADLMRGPAAAELVTATTEAIGPIDILVNAAGIETAAAYTSYRSAELATIITLDLLAPLWLIEAVLPGMLARRSGHIVNICSLASVGALPYGVPYAAAKAGLAGATRSLRVEYAGSGVGFSAVIPGFVKDAGIFANHQRAGVSAPAVFGTVTPDAVGRGVVRAIRRNAPEVIISGRPIRPLLTLPILAPRLAAHLTGWAGVTAVARQVAALHGRLPGQGGSAGHSPAAGAGDFPMHQS